jgi:hypothetical protein
VQAGSHRFEIATRNSLVTATQLVFRQANSLVVGLLALGSIFAPAAVQAQSDPSLFTTVINSPPDVAPATLGSSTQLNLLANDFYNDVTISPGATDVEVNVMNGSIMSIDLGYGNNSAINIHGGNILGADAELINVYGGSALWIGIGSSQFAGGVVYNLYGGNVQIVYASGPESVVNLTSGFLTSDVYLQSGPTPLPLGANGPTLNMTGGSIVNVLTVSAGSTANISGGVLPSFGGFTVEAGGELNLIVTQIAIDQSPVALPLMVPTSILTANTGPDVVTSNLSGVLADGTPFDFGLRYFGGASQINVTLVPEPSTTVMAVALAFATLSLRRGSLSRDAA